MAFKILVSEESPALIRIEDPGRKENTVSRPRHFRIRSRTARNRVLFLDNGSEEDRLPRPRLLIIQIELWSRDQGAGDGEKDVGEPTVGPTLTATQATWTMSSEGAASH
jgi:hypothetical protein